VELEKRLKELNENSTLAINQVPIDSEVNPLHAAARFAIALVCKSAFVVDFVITKLMCSAYVC